MTRQGVYGALFVTLMWGGLLFGGDALLARWPYLWPLHLYLQPEDTTGMIYLTNRAFLLLLGAGLVALAAHLTGDEERMLHAPTRAI